MNLDPHEKVRAEHDAAMRDYLARGGRIERLPVGAMAHQTHRQRINPTVVTKAEREAKKSALAALPTPKKPERAKPAKLEKAPTPPKFGRPGTQKVFILEALGSGPLSAACLAGLLGTTRQVAIQQLTNLRERGLVVSHGSRRNMVWKLCR